MTKYKRNILKVFSVGIACVLVAGCTVGEINFRGDDTSPSGAAGKIGLYDGSLDTNVEDYFDSSYDYYFDESAHTEITSTYSGTAPAEIAAVEITNTVSDNINSAASVIEENIESAASIVEESIDRAFNYIN